MIKQQSLTIHNSTKLEQQVHYQCGTSGAK